MLAILIIEAVALLFLGVLVVGLLRSHAEILRRLHEMGEGIGDIGGGPGELSGAPARRPSEHQGTTGGPGHDLSGQTLDGEAVEIGLVGAPTNTLLAFLSATCYTCEPFWEALAGDVDVPGGARVIAVVQEADSAPRLRKLAGQHLLVVASDRAWVDYEVPGSPHFVYVDGPAGQVVGEGTAATWPQIRDLLDQATAGAATMPTDRMPAGRDNPQRIDLELATAGIGPGDPSLYPDRDLAGREPTATT
jgi:hypothetical protein